MRKFCTNCGKELRSGARFCGECGAPVAVSVPTPPKQTAPAAPLSQPAPQPRPAPAPQLRPVNTTPAAGMQQRSVKATKKRKSTDTLSIVLAVLLVAQTAVVVLYGWPGLAVKNGAGKPVDMKFEKSTIVDGLAGMAGMSVAFSDGAYDGQELENRKTASVDLDEGAASAGYELAFAEAPEGSVMLSAPMPEGLTLAKGESLYLDIGFSMLDGAGEEVMVYDHVEASEQSGQIIAEITPSGYDEIATNVYLNGPSYVRPTYTDKMRFNAQFKVKVINKSQSERFNLIFDKSRLMATSVTEDMIAHLLSRMEQVYGQMKSFGFNVAKRTKWPMDIYVTTLKGDSKKGINTYGQYVSSWLGINYGHMNLSRLLFTSFNLDEATSVFAHELMHFVQECHVSSQFYRLDWLDEATAVFFERYFGGKTDHSARQYELYEGIYPASDDASEGYVRGALVGYWAHKGGWLEGKDALSGTDKMGGLIDLYSTGGYIKESRWLEWINQSVGEPSKYAVDFFTKMVLTDEAVWAEYADKPYNLHGLITDNKLEQIKKFTSELKLSANEIFSEKGQVYSVKVPAYGARVVALSMTKAEQNKLEMDGKLSITAGGGGTLVLIKCRSKQAEPTQGVTVSAPEFRKTLEDKHRYLVLVVNPSKKEKTISFTVTGQIAEKPETDKAVEEVPYSGTYRGIVTNLQIDDEPDLAVTTIVTFIENSGPGGQYSIQCTVDETGKKLIEGKYNKFIRWSNGKVNDDDDFVFSQDGKLFSATLRNLDGTPWVSISGEK